jgi:methyl-accepting chemotaxis protein
VVREFVAQLRTVLSRELTEFRGDLARASTLVADATDGLSRAFHKLESQSRGQGQLLGTLLVDMDRGGERGGSAGVQEVVARASDALRALTGFLKEIGQVSRAGVENTVAMSGQMTATLKVLAGIDTIGQQTHILSINASIEANRMGQGGRGFAVIASEVRNLARYSKDLADKIGDQITRTQDALGMVRSNFETVSVTSDKAVAATDQQASRAIAQMDELSRRIVDGVAKLEAANREIAGAVGEAVRCLQFGDVVGQLITAMSARVDRLMVAVEAMKRVGDATAPAQVRTSVETLLTTFAQSTHMPVSADNMTQGEVDFF